MLLHLTLTDTGVVRKQFLSMPSRELTRDHLAWAFDRACKAFNEALADDPAAHASEDPDAAIAAFIASGHLTEETPATEEAHADG